MAAPTVMNIVTGHVRLGLTAAGVIDQQCQVTSAALNATPNLQTVPATFCSAESQSPGATGFELVITVLQDWTNPSGLCWFLFDNDTKIAYWELALDATLTSPAIMNGQCYLVAPSFGGDAGTVLTSDVTLPVTAKPAKGALAGAPALPIVPSTSATSGTPGTWSPAGSTPPATVAALTAGTPNVVTASPTSAWTTGQYVQTQTSGVPGQAHWSGTAWVTGVA